MKCATLFQFARRRLQTRRKRWNESRICNKRSGWNHSISNQRPRCTGLIEMPEMLRCNEPGGFGAGDFFPPLASDYGAGHQLGHRSRQSERIEFPRGGIIVKEKRCHASSRKSLGRASSSVFKSVDRVVVVTRVTPLRVTTTRSFTP